MGFYFSITSDQDGNYPNSLGCKIYSFTIFGRSSFHTFPWRGKIEDFLKIANDDALSNEKEKCSK